MTLPDFLANDPRVGLTSTVPVEIVLAAGGVPFDLNNRFVGDDDPASLVADAERRGFPVGTCAWIKGLYGAARKHRIRTLVGVVEGDCAETRALLEILAAEGVRIVPFAFPASRRADDLAESMRRLADAFGVDWARAEEEKRRVDAVRALARTLDERAAKGTVRSDALFAALLDTSDFLGDPDRCAEALRMRLDAPDAPEARIRLACAGVPTIWSDGWAVLESRGARVVDHETPRQFARLEGIGRPLVESWLDYTYPYDTASRLADMTSRMAARGVRGLVHYTQSFCHRLITDRLWREGSPVPVLTVEADRPGAVDARTLTRIEAFLEQVG